MGDKEKPELATAAQYKTIMQDRPKKFAAEQVGFQEQSPHSDKRCGLCVHLYSSTAAGRIICEIFRKADDGNIPPRGVCAFWSADGESQPLLAGRGNK